MPGRPEIAASVRVQVVYQDQRRIVDGSVKLPAADLAELSRFHRIRGIEECQTESAFDVFIVFIVSCAIRC
jgi:hypothetical protein